MADDVTTDLLVEHLRRMKSRFDRVKERRDVLAADMPTMRTHIAGFMGTEAIRDTSIAHLAPRLDRIERRLDPRDEG